MARRRGGGRRRRKNRFDGPSDDRSDHVKVEGLVNQVFAGGQFEIELDTGGAVRAQLCGRMRKFRIRVLLGDRVTVALSPYDLTHGMIVFRTK
ncbi:MAG: translation initiation factor IF-1 [Deltaproteobacteria bacterium]|nr:MAG: translation initiation factor IF-1 [Deltaproteobacteria bacterium]